MQSPGLKPSVQRRQQTKQNKVQKCCFCKGWGRHLWLGVCSHNVWNWKINWTQNYLEVLLELVKTPLRSQIGHSCQTENSRFFPDCCEEINPQFLRNMIVGLGRSQSVLLEEEMFFNHQEHSIYLCMQVIKSHSRRGPTVTGPPSSGHDGEAKAERQE